MVAQQLNRADTTFICLGLRYTWTQDQQSLIYEVSSISANVIAEWSKHILEMLTLWPDEKPIQVLFNLSQPKVSIPYMVVTNRDIFNIGLTDIGRTKVQELATRRTRFFGRLALLLPSTTSGFAVQTRSRNDTSAIEGHMFTAYSEAIEWLAEAE